MKKVVILMLVLVPMFAVAQKQEDSQVLIDKFFDAYKNFGPNEAMTYALHTNTWLERDLNDGTSPFRKIGKVASHLGNYMGVEEISSKMIGTQTRIASYMIYYEKQPMMISFELYKNRGNWEFVDVQFVKKTHKVILASNRF